MFKKLSLFLAISILFVVCQTGTVQANYSTVNQSISAGHYFNLAVKNDGTVWAWGNNAHGQLGDNTATNRPLPQQVSNLNNVVAVAAGTGHSMALKDDGTVWTWGNNNVGQLGDGTITKKRLPQQVSGLTSVVQIVAADNSSYALRSDGSVWAWGSNLSKVLGIGNVTSSQRNPVKVNTLSNIVKISAGYKNAAAIDSNGYLYAWGSNSFGQVGTGTTNNEISSPLLLTTITNVKDVSVGHNNIMAITNDGKLWNWGKCDTSGTNESSICSSYTMNPTLVPDVVNAQNIFTKETVAFVIKDDDLLWGFGYNVNGRLGRGHNTVSSQQKIPSPVVKSNDMSDELTNVISVSIGAGHSLALRSDGSLWTWGHNSLGSIGDGTSINRYYAVPVGLNLFDEEQIFVSNSKNIEFGPGGSKKFLFIPSTSGVVNFTTSFWNTNCDPTLTLYDVNNNVIAYVDDQPGSLYETLSYFLNQGEKYYIEIGGYQSSAVNCILTVS